MFHSPTHLLCVLRLIMARLSALLSHAGEYGADAYMVRRGCMALVRAGRIESVLGFAKAGLGELRTRLLDDVRTYVRSQAEQGYSISDATRHTVHAAFPDAPISRWEMEGTRAREYAEVHAQYCAELEEMGLPTMSAFAEAHSQVKLFHRDLLPTE